MGKKSVRLERSAMGKVRTELPQTGAQRVCRWALGRAIFEWPRVAQVRTHEFLLEVIYKDLTALKVHIENPKQFHTKRNAAEQFVFTNDKTKTNTTQSRHNWKWTRCCTQRTLPVFRKT